MRVRKLTLKPIGLSVQPGNEDEVDSPARAVRPEFH